MDGTPKKVRKPLERGRSVYAHYAVLSIFARGSVVGSGMEPPGGTRGVACRVRAAQSSQSSSMNVTFMLTRYSAILPPRTFTDISLIHAP